MADRATADRAGHRELECSCQGRSGSVAAAFLTGPDVPECSRGCRDRWVSTCPDRQRVYDGAHTIPPDLRNNPMPKRQIILQRSETHLPAIADDATQQTRTAGESEAGR
jgi:hypothetical protein